METNWGNAVRARLGMTRDDIFSVPTAARLVGISPGKAYKEIGDGFFPATDLNAGREGKPPLWRVTRDDILEYVRRVEANA